MNRNCIWCDKVLPDRKRKYCSDLCKYRYNSYINDSPSKFSLSQHLRMMRAGKNQRKGKIGARFN